MFEQIQQNFIDIPNEVVEKIYQLRTQDPKAKSRSAVNGWQSRQYTKYSEVPWAEELLTRCLTKSNLTELAIKHYWFNINNKGAYHNWHSHGGADYVGVYYLQIPANSGNIEFKFNEQIQTIEPTRGLLLTFPAGLEHRVSRSESIDDRIAMAFNLHNKKLNTMSN